MLLAEDLVGPYLQQLGRGVLIGQGPRASGSGEKQVTTLDPKRKKKNPSSAHAWMGRACMDVQA